MDKPKICILGLGYIGLPTAAFLANKNFEVNGVDINKSIVDQVNKGTVHIVEPKLDEYVENAVKKNKLSASLTPIKSDIFIIAVPTPLINKKPDISFVQSAIKMIIPVLEKGNLIIIESTCPLGSTKLMAEIIFNESNIKESELFMSYCPERVLPGNLFYELENNDRIIGGINEESTKKTKEFYANFVDGDLLETDCDTAEMAKLTENSFRDVNIAFANELSIICDKNNINVWDLIYLANKHPRVNILEPGPGVGGHCIAVDPWFIVHADEENSKLIKTAREVNLYKEEWVINKILSEDEKSILIYGVTFKPDIDDIRESPALKIAKSINKINGFSVKIIEPYLDKKAQQSSELDFITLDQAVDMDGLHVVLVKHSLFQKKLKNSLKDKKVLDFKGLF